MQVSNWFINARVRLWKPMVEEMYSEEMKDPQQEGGGACSNANNSVNTSSYAYELGQQQLGHGGASGVDGGGGERKPTRAQLVHDAGSLASVVSIGSSRQDQQQQISSINFGMMDHLDFDAYNDDPAAAGGPAGGFGGGGSGGVSLTLGLQQHADDPHGGVNIAFAAAPSAAHEFLFMAGGGEQQMVAGGAVHPSHGHGHHSQFSASMQGDGVASSHYHRGLSAATGFQLLHDLAG
ncbi:unnamed protein product [Miscanthus lutarioriparius]|uniref:Uncharacterized protein n=1 Tax=Miscanthus lutarioriparius TaxID=422564 RepID=A0A811MWF4_9POAL|nr:unnamed protein product [Miscanthus lutarioriparius]